MVHMEDTIWSGHCGVPPQAQLWPNSVQPLVCSHVTQSILNNTGGSAAGGAQRGLSGTLNLS